MLKSFWFWALILFIVIQFFSLNIPANKSIKENEKLQAPQQIPKEVLTILKRSCYDCHSLEVKAPWYYTVAPMSWYTQFNVQKARKVMNFSKWNSYNKEEQQKFLKKLPKAIVIRMPLQSYLYLHEEVALTQKEKELLKSWVKTQIRKE
ncbi:MAG: Unknown protein [uncultured Sulfurovum sp.]|uniref:Haem-binding domain-containing protein n=1 Tax=uncultured Sulfurovum sp. TaxID=269237 RepID=A0A6S6TZ94_9BACT|nr:MAG: Unknown protein [uncultured Sulfurovum sp.]